VPNRQYLAALLDELKGLPVAVEFRNASWANDRVYEGLFRRGAALAAVDVPELSRLFPPVLVMTHPQFFYIRFHGRNAAGWRTGNMQKQFDYDYTEEELKEWVAPKILDAADKAETGFLFFNNHVRAQAPKNAMTMIRLLKDAGLTVG
jgi:uncharacterized protein YecE (DUF72 family)